MSEPITSQKFSPLKVLSFTVHSYINYKHVQMYVYTRLAILLFYHNVNYQKEHFPHSFSIVAIVNIKNGIQIKVTHLYNIPYNKVYPRLIEMQW